MERINVLEKEIAHMRKLLNEKENELCELKRNFISGQTNLEFSRDTVNTSREQFDRLPTWAIERYSRQILLPDIGVKGQEKLCRGKVLVVGAGGLGCPASLYLAGAGVGEIGIVDYDTVDITNIHRQILHSENNNYMNKVDSAADVLRRINSHVKVNTYNVQMDSRNALQIISNYDIVLDCTDNVPTRYLLNDACILVKRPLISGSALKMEGQMTIYGYRSQQNGSKNSKGPCYRCVFPTPPPPETVGSCSANGVAGPVPGIIGTLQALEAIKYLVGFESNKMLVERMLIFDGEDVTFRIVKLRPKNPECAACSDNPTISQLMDYETFCKAKAKEKRKEEAGLKSQRRNEEKTKRMYGQSYYGFRKISPRENEKLKWVQDVPKSGRKLGPPCTSELCKRGTSRHCTRFTESLRREIFNHFWNELDWPRKKQFVRGLVSFTPVKRRRVKLKSGVPRRAESKIYHLRIKDEKLTVCRKTFLNTLGVKEATVRTWLVISDKPRSKKPALKAMNVERYIESLPKMPPKCQLCRNMSTKLYLNLDFVKNQQQLYNMYVKDAKTKCLATASRKTFAKVFSERNLRIFKPKNDGDICDLIGQHNTLPSLSTYQNGDLNLDNCFSDNVLTNLNFNSQW